MSARLLCALALAVSPALGLAADLPPPGLYRIDMDSTHAFAGPPNQTRMRTDGASGDTEARWSAQGKSAARQFKGQGPVTHCVKPNTGAPLPPDMHGCKGQVTSKTADGFSSRSVCPFGNITVTMRQLDKERWEFVTEVGMVTTGAAPDLSSMKPMLTHQAKHGATEQERALARQQLDALPSRQQESTAAYADAIQALEAELRSTTDPQERAAIQASLDSLRPGTPTMQAKSRAVWTRIGNGCKAGK